MTALSTYCSARKDPSPGMLPAIRRYRSRRIQRVYQAARSLEVPFYILSGAFGAIAPEREIPYYDHLLRAGEVDALADTIAGQLHGIGSLAYFTRPLESDANLRAYLDAMAAGCRRAGIRLCVLELTHAA